MNRTLASLILVLSAVTASAIVTRATYLRKAAFRDTPGVCFRPVNPGQGQPVSAFDVTVTVCPQIDPAQVEDGPGFPCQPVTVPGYAATPAQKNWVKGAWSAAHATAVVPEAAADAP